MTDNELLQLAAKAAGYKLGYFERKVGHRDEPTLLTGVGLLTENGRDWLHWPHFWNPLMDDGDALRLAADCWINIEYGGDYVRAEGPQGISAVPFSREIKEEKRAAVRKAIVNVAAELGKQHG